MENWWGSWHKMKKWNFSGLGFKEGAGVDENLGIKLCFYSYV